MTFRDQAAAETARAEQSVCLAREQSTQRLKQRLRLRQKSHARVRGLRLFALAATESPERTSAQRPMQRQTLKVVCAAVTEQPREPQPEYELETRMLKPEPKQALQRAETAIELVFAALVSESVAQRLQLSVLMALTASHQILRSCLCVHLRLN